MADYVLISGICQWQNGIQISVRHLDEISGVAEDDAMEAVSYTHLDVYKRQEVPQDDIKAEFKHGILTLFVPKKEAKPAVEQKHSISIEG